MNSSCCDPPITARGRKEARATGEFLKSYFKANNYQFDEVIVECSPFLSCIMTAGLIGNIIGLENRKKPLPITLNYRSSDILTKYFLQKGKKVEYSGEDPMKHLEVTKYRFQFYMMDTGKQREFPEGSHSHWDPEEYFTPGVHYHEPKEKANFKD